ncbi:MAG: GAF domain-containing sensor histidine kinase [Phototrophicaceae bacterium]
MGKTLEDANRDLTILNRIAEALNREVDLAQALQVAMANIVDLFNLDTGWIFLLDEQSGKYYTAATIGLPPALADHPRRMAGTCHCIDTYEDGDMDGAANINAITCSRLKGLRKGTDGLRYHASIPLYAQAKRLHSQASDTINRQLGILNVASTDWREISDDELRVLHTVGDLMSIAIERARLFQRSAEHGAISERNRIAREIHDTIAQGLAALALKLETVDVLLDNGADRNDIRIIINSALLLTRDNLEEARRSVMDLRAAPLEGKTLKEAILLLFNDNHLQGTVDMIGSSPPLSIRVESALYRIAQEAITNIGKHARATSVIVQIILTPERVRLVIEDDGIGFDMGQPINSGRFGLVGLKERVKLLHGTVDIVSCVGSGTVIETSIPLDSPDE